MNVLASDSRDVEAVKHQDTCLYQFLSFKSLHCYLNIMFISFHSISFHFDPVLTFVKVPPCQALCCTITTGRTEKGESLFRIPEIKNAT